MRSCKLKDLIKLSCAFVLGYAIRNLFDLRPDTCSCPLCVCAKCEPCSQTAASEVNSFETFQTQLREVYKPRNMYDVLHYEYLSTNYAYDNYNSDPRIGLLGHQKSDLKSITEDVTSLFSHTIGKNVYFKKLIHAYRRFDPGRGEELLLDVTFGDKQVKYDSSEKNYRLEVVKPFRNLQLVKSSELSDKKTIHFIIPVYNATSRLNTFLNQYEEICLKSDKNCYLLIILFKGSSSSIAAEKKQISDVNDIVVRLRRKYEKSRMRVVQTAKPFSRATALNLGVQQFPVDYLLFFCDVDIFVMPEFLQRCRNNAGMSQQVYYPGVFALYDPTLVEKYSPFKKVVNPKDINKYTGHWMHYGYGMVCLYGKDYHDVGGFDTSNIGWGGEDVDLYQKHVKSNIKVLRAMDPGLIHLHHKKSCDPSLGADKLRQCRDSGAESLASKTQLAKMVMEKELVS